MDRPDTTSATVSDDCLKFTAEELALFERRFQEGYDIVDDSKYSAWLQKFHPNQSSGNGDAPTCRCSCHCEKDKDGKDNSVQMLKPLKCTKKITDNDCIMLCHSTVLSKCIDTAVKPNIQVPNAKPKNPARILTSHEHLQLVTEKEERKIQEAKMKEQRRIEREEKQREKNAMKTKQKRNASGEKCPAEFKSK